MGTNSFNKTAGPFGNECLLLTGNGLNIIPLNGKKPILNSWSYYCTNEILKSEINKWRLEYSGCNIGITCGKFNGVIGFDLDLDLDIPENQIVADKIALVLPEMKIIKKGMKGYTAFFKYDESAKVATTSLKFNGTSIIDILGHGRQSVLPPSVHPITNSPYVYLKGDIIGRQDIDSLPILTESHIEAVRQLLKSLESGERKKTKQTTGRNNKLKDMVSAALFKSKSDEEIITSIVNYDFENHNPPLLTDPTEPLMVFKSAQENAKSFVSRIRESVKDSLPKLSQRYSLVSFKDLKSTPIPPIHWIVDGLLASGTTSILSGEPKVGKSTLARQLVISALAGKDVLNRKSKFNKNALVVSIEEHIGELKKSLLKISAAVGADCSENLILLTESSGTLNAEVVEELISQNNIGLAILDPISFFIGKETKSDDYSSTYAFYNRLNETAKKYDCHIMVVSHMRKASASGDLSTSFDSTIGSVAHTAATFTNMTLKKNSKGERILETRGKAGDFFDGVILTYNKETQTFAYDQSTKQLTPYESKKLEVMALLEREPGISAELIWQKIPCKGVTRNQILTELLTESKIIRQGSGKSNDAFMYFINVSAEGL